MNYLSVCSGIEAASVAWHPLGWRPYAFSEIEKFPSRVLAHHYPDTPNFGDMTKFQEWPDATIDVLVGGTPCQSFSVAGLRAGLADPRGNLMLAYLAIAGKYRPKWLVWENVPGVLSSNGGRDFGALLGGLAKLGYGFAYRVLDAQYFGVAQRRRRVFVVGYLGDWRRAAAVLFERDSLLGNPAPRREAGKEVAGTISSRTTGGGGLGTDFECAGGLQPVTFDRQSSGEYGTDSVASTIPARDYKSASDLVVHGTQDPCVSDSTAFALGRNNGAENAVLAFGVGEKPDLAHCLRSGASKADKHESTTYIAQQMAVRRLAPTECERLQGFPDDYTAIPGAADGPRYKALGNSMAVNVMRWIGTRIAMVDAIDARVEIAA